MSDGQVYVPVQADVSSYASRSVGTGNGQVQAYVIIKWDFNGGVTAKHGWDSPRKVYYVEGDVTATNAAVYDAYFVQNPVTMQELVPIIDCVDLNYT